MDEEKIMKYLDEIRTDIKAISRRQIVTRVILGLVLLFYILAKCLA